MSHPRSPLPPEVRRLGWVSFWLDVASEMVYPLVPLFVASVLQAPGLALGLIEGVADGLFHVLTALSGRHSDRLRRRVPFIRLGYGLAAAAKPLLGLVTTWPALLALRALDRAGKGLRTAARDALIADVAGPGRRGEAFGFHRAMDTAGAIAGVLLALGLLALLAGQYRTIFALTAIPGACAVLLTFRIREPERARTPAHAPLPPLSALLGSLWRACGVMWIFALGSPSPAFLLLRARDHGLLDAGVVGLYLLMNVVYALVALPAGRLSDRLGRTRVMALGWSVFAASFAAFGLLEDTFAWFGFALYGAHLGLTQGAAKAWITDHAPTELRGTALGVYQLGLGVALLASSVLAGALWDGRSHAAPFAVGGGFALLALALLPWASAGRR